MNSLLRISSAVFFALLLVGCFPEIQTKIPDINGQVLRSGLPVQGVAVTVTRKKDDCSEPIRQTSTGPDGRFFISRIRELGIGRIFVSPGQEYSVCLDSGSGAVVAWTQAAWVGPASKTMSCDLANGGSLDQEICDQK